MSVNLGSLQSKYNDLLTAKKNVDVIINEGHKANDERSKDRETEIQ